MIGIVGMDALAIRARGVRTVCAVRAGRIKLGDDLRKKLMGIPGPPRVPVERLLPIPVFVAPEILIAAVEQHERRMRRQSYDVLAGLGFNLLPERRLFRIRRARQQEVLPHKDSALVFRSRTVPTVSMPSKTRSTCS
jgi:hypothetical protein